MSAEFDEIRRAAVRIAINETHLHVRETGMQNRGTRIDDYLRAARVPQRTMDNETLQGAEDRRWCGMFIYYCYLQAVDSCRELLPFEAETLWGGRSLNNWAMRHYETVVTNQPVQPGDIFALRNNHIGMAITEADADKNFGTIEGNQSELGDNWDGIAVRNTTIRNRTNRRNQNICRVIVRI